MEVVFLFNQPLDNEFLEKMQIDICVCNVGTDKAITEAHQIRLSDVPLNSEWADLLVYLHKAL